MNSPPRPIATMNEGPLHAALKKWYAEPGDQMEVPVDGRQIDIVRGDLLIEIQTNSFAALRNKLEKLLASHSVRLVHPVPVQKWIIRIEGKRSKVLGRRKSPKRGRLEDAFEELVSLARILSLPRFSLEILLTHEEVVRRHDPRRAWRRKGWVTVERRLVDVVDRRLFGRPCNLVEILPNELPIPFTTADIAQRMQISRDLAQKIAYCLRAAGVIHVEGKKGNARIYQIV